MKKYKIILIISLIIISYALLWVYLIIAPIISKMIPEYQKVEAIDPLIICKEIRDKKLQELCVSEIKKPENQETITSDGQHIYKKGNSGYCYSKENRGWCCFYYHKENYIYNTSRELYIDQTPPLFPNYINHERALLENPYYCSKMTSVLFDGPHKENCYRDSALVWQDPALCKKTKDKDFCYFCLAVEEPVDWNKRTE